MDVDEPKQMRRAAKIGHRKSRNGCVTCKSRRVKCNEIRPTCGNCLRLGLDCTWSTESQSHPPPAPQAGSPSSPSGRASSTGHSPNSASLSASASTSALTPESALGIGADHLKHEPTRSAGGSPAIGSSSNGTSYAYNYQSQPQGAMEGMENLARNEADARYAVENMWTLSSLSDALQRSPNPSANGTASGPAPTSTSRSQDLPFPESRERRLLEHRLMHTYMNGMGAGRPLVPNKDWAEIWSTSIPDLSLRFDNLLYALLTSSATYLLTQEPDSRELFTARQRYLMATMRAQRAAVDTLSYETADAACFASMFLNITAFSMMSERNLTPYTPPLEWLSLGRGAGSVIWMCVEAVHKGPEQVQKESAMFTVAQAYPRFGFDTSYFDASHRDQFAGVMNRALPDSRDVWDEETTEAYEKALSYVGSVQTAVVNGEPPHILARRAQGFSLVVPPKFVELLGEMRPRALVILAHFFAIVYQIKDVWWLGQGPIVEGRERLAKREVRALRDEIPASWRAQMLWPLDVVGIMWSASI